MSNPKILSDLSDCSFRAVLGVGAYLRVDKKTQLRRVDYSRVMSGKECEI